MHERGAGSDCAGQPLRAAGARKEAKLSLRQSDQVVAILSNTQIAGECELESTRQGGSGNRGDDGLWHGFAQGHGLVEKPPIVGRVVGPRATGSAQRLCKAEQRSDGKMPNKIAGRAASDDDDANFRIARK